MTTENPFLVSVDKATGFDRLLSCYFMEGYAELDDETRQVILDRMKERQNGLDIRIVVEGIELPFDTAEKMLKQGFERAKQQALKDFLNDHLREIQEGFEEALKDSMRGMLQSFGVPDDQDQE